MTVLDNNITLFSLPSQSVVVRVRGAFPVDPESTAGETTEEFGESTSSVDFIPGELDAA